VFQLFVVNVRFVPPVTLMSPSPDSRMAVTVTFVHGWALSFTWKVFVPFSGTVTELTLVVTLM